MAKTTRILIPSDFTLESLDFVSQSIDESTADQIDIILVYGNRNSTSASELLGIGLEDQLDVLQSASFLKACSTMYQRYQTRKLSIFADILGTDNGHYLQHYLKGQSVDEIIIPSGYNYKKKTRNFFNVADALRNVQHQIRPTVSFKEQRHNRKSEVLLAVG
ncbi:hypothetical protein [Sphingobacterium sp.]|uniref:hypothetical protein n=1 Tax=Sphingobacterium sp. TaxID=341027 RepID=UPI0028A063C8|nr:hypothetical protein [Sphingobacterium sp.]